MLKNLLARILIFEQIQEQVIEFKRGQLYHFNLPTAITIFNHNEHFRQHEKKKYHQNMTTWQLSQMLWRIKHSAVTFHVLHITLPQNFITAHICQHVFTVL